MATIQPSSISKEEVNDKNINDGSNKLLIVTGNGFDLECGLPSSYCDFFRSLIDKNLGAPNAQFCDILDSGNYKLISQNYVTTHCTTIWEYYLYFKYKEARNQDGLFWFDIEEQLTDFFKENGFWDNAKSYIDMVKPSPDGNSVFPRSLTEWNVYSVALYALYHAYCQNKDFVLYDVIRKEVIYNNFYKALNEDLRNFEKKFSQYLSSLKDMKDGTYDKKRTELFDEIVSSVGKKIGKCSNPFICTFNYTSAETNSKYKIQYVHGDLNSPIFGINDQLADNKKELNIFTKKYKRTTPHDKSEKRPTYTDILGESKDVKYNIVFYGLSFAETDYYDFDLILDYFNPDYDKGTKIFLCAPDKEYLDDMNSKFRIVFEKKFPSLSYDKLLEKNKIVLINIRDKESS